MLARSENCDVANTPNIPISISLTLYIYSIERMPGKKIGIVALSSLYIVGLLIVGDVLLYKEKRESSEAKRSMFSSVCTLFH